MPVKDEEPKVVEDTKAKTAASENEVEIVVKKRSGSFDETSESKIPKVDSTPKKRCASCRQWLDAPTTPLYSGHPDRAVDQFTAICTDSIRVDLGDDQKPQFRITEFSFYDIEGHLVSLDSGIVENGKNLFMSGYLKSIVDENPTLEGGIPVFDVGPIVVWWTGGFDGGEENVVAVSTEEAEYYLRLPSKEYKPVWKEVMEKTKLVKIVIEVLEEGRSGGLDITYEDLILRISDVELEDGIMLSQEALHKNAAFIIDQVNSYDCALDYEGTKDSDSDSDYEGGDDDKPPPLMITPCMRDLIKFSGIRELSKKRRKIKIPGISKPKPPSKQMVASKATLTPLVRDIFEVMFRDQVKGEDGDAKQNKRDKRCGVCDNCQKADCGVCRACKDMVKFQGSGKSKQACIERKCPNMGYYDTTTLDDSMEEEENQAVLKPVTPTKHKIESGFKKGGNKERSHVKWLDSEPTRVVDGVSYYDRISINDEEFKPGDFVMLRPDDPLVALYVAFVVNMYNNNGTPRAHIIWMSRSSDTVLGETGDPQELYVNSDCEDVKLSAVAFKAEVIRYKVPDDWKDLGGTDDSLVTPLKDKNEKHFFYRFHYEERFCRFETFDKDLCSMILSEAKCGMCSFANRKRSVQESPSTVAGNGVKVKGFDYFIGDGVFLSPAAFDFRYSVEKIFENQLEELNAQRKEKINHHKYPEKYRKGTHVKGSNFKTNNPFCIGIIREIVDSKNKIKIKVRKMYRPENTHVLIECPAKCWSKDLNFLYWSDEEVTVDAASVQGKCYIRPEIAITEPLDEWSKAGQFRFYYNRAYNIRNREFAELSIDAENYGRLKGSKGKGKGKTSKAESTPKQEDDLNRYPDVTRRMRTLDVFAGCGGLSRGLYDAGVSQSTWAIELFKPAASAFKSNHGDCTVFTDDCNKLLEEVMEGKIYNEKKQKLPQKGEVEFLCGGPPCQGFSGMNRFNHREYSLFKNSLVTSYLSYCDYYRPRFFILENVRNFASFKKSMVLKMCMSALVRMGYQCTFGVLQAGMFGVAQTRRRAILLAAAPGEKLPMYPDPMHVFAKTTLTVQVNDRVYESNARWTESAPYRTITVRDTMSDLPRIKNGDQIEIKNYEVEPESPFQKAMRKDMTQLRDHITKFMAPLIEARMSLIPTLPGSDWRDLPNIRMELSDGAWSDVLIYPHNDYVQGKSPIGTLRGVCVCATKKNAKCDPMDKQGNTLVPWCLPHTSNRHNHWAGLYGRLEWDGFFSTTVTNPEPMGKQGRVLHPEQHRLVSVRECARSQGFPDSYKFYGSVLEKHRQIGNAVPPPMGYALGIEVRKAMMAEQTDLFPLKDEA